MPTKLIRKQFLLTKEENSKIEKQAKSSGLSVSNLTRMLYGLQPLKKGIHTKKGQDNITESIQRQRGKKRK